MTKFLGYAALAGALGMAALTAAPALADTSQNPTWSVPFGPNGRFQVQPFGDAVLDKETGLVWELAPSTEYFTWFDATNHCIGYVFKDSRAGWRLPTIYELSSLIDPTQEDPALPPGNPFNLNLTVSEEFWTATIFAAPEVDDHYVLDVDHAGDIFEEHNFGYERAWCVRTGTQQVDPNLD